MIPVLLLGILFGIPLGWIACALVATAREANDSEPMEHEPPRVFTQIWSDHIYKGE
jgi:hypothetical protein